MAILVERRRMVVDTGDFAELATRTVCSNRPQSAALFNARTKHLIHTPAVMNECADISHHFAGILRFGHISAEHRSTSSRSECFVCQLKSVTWIIRLCSAENEHGHARLVNKLLK
jgi:hypothetical protein